MRIFVLPGILLLVAAVPVQAMGMVCEDEWSLEQDCFYVFQGDGYYAGVCDSAAFPGEYVYNTGAVSCSVIGAKDFKYYSEENEYAECDNWCYCSYGRKWNEDFTACVDAGSDEETGGSGGCPEGYFNGDGWCYSAEELCTYEDGAWGWDYERNVCIGYDNNEYRMIDEAACFAGSGEYVGNSYDEWSWHPGSTWCRCPYGAEWAVDSNVCVFSGGNNDEMESVCSALNDANWIDGECVCDDINKFFDGAVCVCGSGYVEYDGACYQMCAAGIGHIHVGGDVSIPLFVERLTTPALNVMYNGTVCYANAASGAAAGTINIRLSDGAIYHLLK